MYSRQSKWASADEAVKAIKSGDRVIVPICCGLPTTLIDAMIADKNRLKNVEIAGGLQMEYKFLDEGLEESFSYRTWQCTPRIRHLVKKGTVKYIPMRQGDAPAVFSPGGIWPIDVALIHTTPPDKNGYLSLGVSISHSLPTALGAKTVIAQVNQFMPRVLGDSFLHISQVDYLVKSDKPLLEYPSAGKIGDIDRKIAEYVAELIPDGSTIEIGIGSIPEAVLSQLTNRRRLKFFAMGVDGMVDLVEKGVVEMGRGEIKQAPLILTEILGTKRLFDFVDNNSMVEGRHSLIDPRKVGAIDNFVSILGTIEVDLTGQLNAETVGGKQISAIGGGFDFLQGANFSQGGKSIIAMTSTTPDGKISRIVSQLPLGSAVTHPRHSVQYIVTEFGIADLRGKTLQERAEALIAVANPDFRQQLKESWDKIL